MEWIGWWFQWRATADLSDTFGAVPGPRYGHTTIDVRVKHIWDLKAHPNTSDWLVANDREAIDQCIRDNGVFGCIVACGDAQFDDGRFQQWHEALKGGPSRYQQRRRAEGAPSRRRKAAFDVRGYLVAALDAAAVSRGLREGWLGLFQTGMRNANDTPRRAKYQINVRLLPADLRRWIPVNAGTEVDLS